ncbi:hypothetical protein CWATWH0401_2771 [Crocosphaera watsonii WH 0401]|uniref:Uncharacterized protein n=1 Tax=Crocosphaera watsonii WH 0401 TaxID=555881 RepID=T2J4I7_CROWT|nr:hypothetical protein CWATWH0401_2771 [Crocosphaera watsonii WH 0401]
MSKTPLENGITPDGLGSFLIEPSSLLVFSTQGNISFSSLEGVSSDNLKRNNHSVRDL